MQRKYLKKENILTIPNLLSLIRILLIPFIIWLYCAQKAYLCTIIVIALSGFTDIIDGKIARKFNMVSDVGKVLDPVADKLTQATLSRDLKQLKVAKAASMGGNYVYVLPNVAMYKRISSPAQVKEMMRVPGFISINFSGNMGVIKTRPGYASSIAYNIDNSDIPYILGTIAGDDTIFIVISEHATEHDVITALSKVVPNMI